MRHSEFDIQNGEPEVAWPGTPLLALVIALFVAAMWLGNGPSFEKCSTLENATERYACYDTLRDDLSKPPAKGADIQRAKSFAPWWL